MYRLIAFTFLKNPEKYPVVNHLDYDKANNHISNLEWTTYSNNTNHSFQNHHRDNSIEEWKNKVQPLVAEASKTKVTQYSLNGDFIAVFNSQKEASKATGVCRSSITNCVNHKRKTAGGYKWEYALNGSTTT